jgi:anti-sigma factor RsiW
MKQTTDNEELMVKYLLGELPEDEQLRLEERFFTDDEFYQQLLALEDELMYDYAAGGLSPEQRVKFERRYLDSPQARRKAELAGAVLNKAAEASARRAPAPVVEERRSLWQSLTAFFSLQNPAMQFSLAAASALLFVGASWLFYQTTRLRSRVEQIEAARVSQERQSAESSARQQRLAAELERERSQRAQLEQELAKQQAARDRDSQPSSSSTFLSFILAPGLVRDADGPKRLLIPASVNSLRLQLDLKRPGDYRSYRAALQTLDGTELWSQNLSRARSTASGRAVIVTLPARLLPPGDYVIALKGRTGGGEIEEVDDYYFSVVTQ